jgi:hypothetical protein
MRSMSEPRQDEPRDDDEAVEVEEEKGVVQPAGSLVIVERFPDGLTLQVPPAGVWRGTQGLFVFAIIWNGIVTMISAVMLAAVMSNKAKPDDSIWIMPLIMSIFWLVGIGMLLGALNMGRRKAAIAVTGGTLMVIQTGLFGTRQRDWQPGDVEAIRAGPSGMKINDRDVLELQIYDGGASKFGLLCGRGDDELRWLAAELRQVLAVPDVSH